MRREIIKEIATKAAIYSTIGDFGVTISTLIKLKALELIKNISIEIITFLTLLTIFLFVLDFFLSRNVIKIKIKEINKNVAQENNPIKIRYVKVREITNNQFAKSNVKAIIPIDYAKLDKAYSVKNVEKEENALPDEDI
ncbi:MAG: hypothetical protein OH318_01120 [Candidatus Parvarchaeota archaeon]|nr:hypothetical protein [Candidatus Rehaiarchaeum fermentans]MCW1292977.1 hypothetical protein [Candidatus Rehaiarchaeum fermentans]MCW1293459.1 hypothetical protein [Candidatus Rehaiarchaeum fermentans]